MPYANLIPARSKTAPDSGDSAPPLLRAAGSITTSLALVSIAIGLSALLGHWAGLTFLVTWREDLGYIVPNTALLLILTGTSLILQARSRRGIWTKRLGTALALVATADVLITASEYIWNTDLLIDNLLIGRLGAFPDPELDNRTGIGSLTCLGLLCGSLLLLRTHRFVALCISTFCTSLCMVLVIAVLMGYGFNVADESPFWNVLDMALPTCLGTAASSIGIVFARPDRPAARAILSASAGGSIARRLLPICVGVPVILAALYTGGLQLRFVDQPAGLAILTAITIAVFAFVVQISSSALNRSDRLRSAAEAHRTRMLHELDHRVKNNLASVLALFDQTSRSAADVEQLRITFRGRLSALARAHEALAASRWESVPLSQVIESVVSPFAPPGSPTLQVAGSPVLLPAPATLPVAVTMHELATNAAKHGALRDGLGRVHISWAVNPDNQLVVRWNESGPAVDLSTSQPGYGTTLIRGIVAHELGGSADLQIRPDGVECTIVVPLASPDNPGSRGLRTQSPTNS